MPAHPAVSPDNARLLTELGERLRLARLRRKLTAQRVADTAGITRVTLHRLESGAASTTLGTLLQVMEALGMPTDLSLLARDDHIGQQMMDAALPARRSTELPQAIRLADLPHLREVAAWHLGGDDITLTPSEALSLYERNWRHIDPARITGKEAAILRKLTRTIGKGVLLV